MKKLHSYAGGMMVYSEDIFKSFRHWLQSLRYNFHQFIIRNKVREKWKNSSLSWEERWMMMGLILLAGIILLGIKMYENNRSNIQAYTQLDESRRTLIEVDQFRYTLKELQTGQLQVRPELLSILNKIQTIKTLSGKQAIRLNVMKQLLFEPEQLQKLHLVVAAFKLEEQTLQFSREQAISLGNSIDQRLFSWLISFLILLILLAGYLLRKHQRATAFANEQLENNKLTLQSIIDNSSSLVYVKDRLGQFIFTNKKFSDLFEKNGERWDEKRDENVLASNQVIEHQDNLLIGGRQYHFYTIRFPLKDRNGVIYATGGISTDITALIHQQQESRKMELAHNTICAQEKERTDIGMELHDNISQLLASAKMMLDTAIRHNSHEDEHLHKARADVFTAIHETRKLSHSLVVPDIETETLTDAITRVLNRLQSDHQIAVQCTLLSRKKINALEPAKRLAIFRILQEQVNNILKHSGADKVQVALNLQEQKLKLLITDNGKGFNLQASKNGIGLSNINQRVQSLGGSSQLETQPGMGCRLTVEIPI